MVRSKAYLLALAMIVRDDINRTLAAAGRPETPTDRLDTAILIADWRLLRAGRVVSR